MNKKIGYARDAVPMASGKIKSNMMKMKILFLTGLAWLFAARAMAQSSQECVITDGLDIAFSEVNFNYGSNARAFSLQFRSSLICGQPFTGS
ncbi:MAG: hypothetical protein RI973_2227, partial [Bacteroidota bacterium]